MAPEVIKGKEYTEKADVFSFGIILWEIATRQPPYRNLTAVQVGLQVAHNKLRPKIPKNVPSNFSFLMQRCWDTDPNMRPSFKQCVREIKKWRF